MELISVKDKLCVPLRQWMIPPSPQQRLWPVYYDPIANSMFFRKHAQFERHDALDEYFSFQPTCSKPTLPKTAYPISVQEVDLGSSVSAYSSYCPTLPSLPPSSFASFCSLLDDWESKLLSTVTFLYDPFNLASLLEMSNFKACSNGSAVAYIGTYGWVLSLEDGTRLANGSGPVDGKRSLFLSRRRSGYA
jgi:hypothetical protein